MTGNNNIWDIQVLFAGPLEMWAWNSTDRGGPSQLLKVCLVPHKTKIVINIDFHPTVLEMSLLELRFTYGVFLSIYFM